MQLQAMPELMSVGFGRLLLLLSCWRISKSKTMQMFNLECELECKLSRKSLAQTYLMIKRSVITALN